MHRKVSMNLFLESGKSELPLFKVARFPPLVFYWSVLLLILCSLGCLAPLGAQDFIAQGQLFGDFWAPLQTLRPGELQPPEVNEESLTLELLQEAHLVFSGMIHGWKVLYRPSDERRLRAEVLEVEALGQIPWGSPDLRFVSERLVRETGRIYGRFKYLLNAYEIQKLKGWHGVGLPQGGAWGEVFATLPFENRLKSLEEALKESLRVYLRPRLYEKPQEIQAEMVLKKTPYYLYQAGRVRCKVEVIIRIIKVKPYVIY